MSTIPVRTYPGGCVQYALGVSLVPVVGPDPADEPVQVADVVRHLKWPPGTPDEQDIPRWIDAARLIIERETRLALATQQVDLFLDPWGGAPIVLRLPLAPVQTIDAIAAINTDGTETDLDPADWYADVRRSPCRLVILNPGGTLSHRVRFTAGYTPATVPIDLVHALLMLTADFAMHRGDERDPRGDVTTSQALALVQRYVPAEAV